jgi:hypothetical protein
MTLRNLGVCCQNYDDFHIADDYYSRSIDIITDRHIYNTDISLEEEVKWTKEENSIRKRQEECKFLFAAYQENYNNNNNNNKDSIKINSIKHNDKVLKNRKVISSSS